MTKIDPETVTEMLSWLRGHKVCVGFKSGPSEDGGHMVMASQYGPDPQTNAAADMLEALAARVAELEALLSGRTFTVDEGREWRARAEAMTEALDEVLKGASDEDLLRELVRRNPPSKAPRTRTMHDQDCLIGIGKDHHCYITFGDEDLIALQEVGK